MQDSKKIKCAVVDDEFPAREILKRHIMGVEALELSGTCSNAVEAISFLKDKRIDLLFLDIQMPQLLGTNFIRTLKNPPKVIFTTAYRKYALEGFELDAVDFLLKPINFERFLKAVNKVLQFSLPTSEQAEESTKNSSDSVPPFLYFRVNRKMVKVLFNEILYIEGLNDYVKIVTTNKIIVTKHLLGSLEQMLPSNEFVRIHKSFIIALNKIESFNADSVQIREKELPIGRLFKLNLDRFLNNLAAPASLRSANFNPLKNYNSQ